MVLPQIDATTCVILVTFIVWAWTRLKLPLGCHFWEASLRRQSYHSYWAFASLIGLEILSETANLSWIPWLIGPLSGLIFYIFAIATFQSGQGFWSKRRNQVLSLTPLILFSLAVGLLFENPSFVPMFAGFAIGQLCHKKYLQLVYASIQDLDILQAKILKQEATHANMRHFEKFALRSNSQQA